MEIDETRLRIMNHLFREIAVIHSVSSLSKELRMTRVGIWKSIKKLQKEGFINIDSINDSKTSAGLIRISWDSMLTEKLLSFALVKDACQNKRWVNSFVELKEHVDFLIIYGSILHSPKEANDIDILYVTNRNAFGKIDQTLIKLQKVTQKRIHSIGFTSTEFEGVLKEKNKAFIDAIKHGVVLFGQDEFISFIKKVTSR